MSQVISLSSRLFIVVEVLGFVALAMLSKAAVDPITWRYSGPISLVFVLIVMLAYLRLRKVPLTTVGFVGLSRVRNWLWLVPQIVLAFIAIMGTGVGLSLLLENFGPEAVQIDRTGADERFGDLEGNLPHYLMWLAILWVAGPAEEFFFRGFLTSRLSTALGRNGLRLVLVVVLPALFFGFGHGYYQGLRGMIVTGGIGLSLGILFVLYRWNVWPLAVAHAAFNTLIFTSLFAGWDL